MYTEYNSDNVKNVIYGNPDDYKEEKPNKFLRLSISICLASMALLNSLSTSIIISLILNLLYH